LAAPTKSTTSAILRHGGGIFLNRLVELRFPKRSEQLDLWTTVHDDLQAGRFRHALSGQVRLRNIPALEFILDESIEHGDSMSRMLASLRPEDQDD